MWVIRAGFVEPLGAGFVLNRVGWRCLRYRTYVNIKDATPYNRPYSICLNNRGNSCLNNEGENDAE